MRRSKVYFNGGVNRVFVPKEISILLGIKEGDTIEYVVRKNGSVVIQKIK